MKRMYFLVSSLLAISAVSAQSSRFTLSGDMKNFKAPAEWVYLSYIINGQRVTDSALVRDNKYSFTGSITEPVQASLRIKYRVSRAGSANIIYNNRRDYVTVFLEPGSIGVISADSLSNITVSGSIADDEYRRLAEMSKPYDNQLSELYRQLAIARKNKEADLLNELEKKIDAINNDGNERVYGDYVKQHPASPIAMYALKNWAGYEMDAAKVEPVFKTLPEATRQSPSGMEMQEKLVIAKKTAIGQIALDFTQNDTLGVPVALHSFRGKYVLVDFWASWCGPCRAENPAVVTAFNKYSKKGFYILSVSLDRPGAKEKWLKAIHDDGLNWSHVSDLQFWENAVAKQYGIQAIPQNLLLDPSGKIIAKNLRGEALDKKLASIYTN